MSDKRPGSTACCKMSRTITQLEIGECEAVSRTLEMEDLKAWGSATGEQVSSGEGGLGILVAMLNGLASSRLPGPGTIIKAIQIHLKKNIVAGDVVKAQLCVKEKKVADRIALLDATCSRHDDEIIASGTLEVLAPEKSVPLKVPHSLDGLLTRCELLPPISGGVVWPLSEASLLGAIESAHLVTPVLYGPKAELEALAVKAGVDLSKFNVKAAETPEDAALQAAIDAGEGKLQALMKGSLHTDVFLHAILKKEAKLKTNRLLSHCALISAPTYPERIILSDVALNIAPDIDQKRDICQNAIGFAYALGFEKPRVAVLSAIETVNTKMPSTLDAAILAKMGDRNQITDATIDGPLDLDAAIDADAARIKQIHSPVAGIANILIVPNIESGNLIYKQFSFMADAQTADLVVGARVPVILTSRADTADKRRFSAAAAVLYAKALAQDPGPVLGIKKD